MTEWYKGIFFISSVIPSNKIVYSVISLQLIVLYLYVFLIDASQSHLFIYQLHYFKLITLMCPIVCSSHFFKCILYMFDLILWKSCGSFLYCHVLFLIIMHIKLKTPRNGAQISVCTVESHWYWRLDGSVILLCAWMHYALYNNMQR